MSACACGCGKPAGDRRFVHGHNRRLGFDKPRREQAVVDGRHTRRHVLVAERALGHKLPVGAVVHHYSDAQLVICQSQSYHMLLHRRATVIAHGGNPETERYCYQCRRLKPLHAFGVKRGTCRPCHVDQTRKSRKRRRAA